MTWDERVAAVAAQTRGLTDRQAAFLVTVMLHAGVCVLRQYGTFTAMPHGRKITDFFRLLLNRGYATAQSCRHNRARIFHIHYKPLYAAIGEPDNRHRKPTPLPRAIERLMVLDAVLADRDRTWLATEQDKLTHFTLTHRIPRQDLPSLIFRAQDTETVRSIFGPSWNATPNCCARCPPGRFTCRCRVRIRSRAIRCRRVGRRRRSC